MKGERFDCSLCRTVQKDVEGKVRCEGIEKAGTCPDGKIPDPLFPENEDAASILMACRDQVLSAPVGDNKMIVTISLPAIEAAMRARGIPEKDQWEMMLTVKRLWHETRSKGGDEG